MEINNFEVDEKNIYNLPEGKKRSVCPICSADRKKSKEECLEIKWDKGLADCHHCGETLQLHTYKRKGNSQKEYVKPPKVDNYTPPPQGVLDWFINERGISEQTVKELRITHSQQYIHAREAKVGVIDFNFYVGDELVNIQYRDAKKNFLMFAGAEKVFYNINSTVGHDEVIITEGQMDVCAIHEAGMRSVVSVPNGASKNLDYLDNTFEYFEDKKKIILAVDNDEKGNILKQELIRRLGAEVCYLVDFKDCKDANEYLLKYGKEELKECLKQAKQVPLEGVSTLKDHLGELETIVRDGFKKGYVCGLENLDEIFSTYTSQFFVVTGMPSSGKSDLVDAMCLGYNKNYGWRVAYASPENQPLELHTHKLVRKRLGTMPRESDLGTDRWNKVVEEINDDFFFIDMDKYSLDSVLKKAEELVKRKGIRVLILDPYNKIRDRDGGIERDVNEYTLNYLNKIDDFCKRNDVLVILVAHPVKMYPDRTTGKFPMPTFYDIKGGGEFYDASYHGLVAHRDYETGTTTVKVLKVKFQNLGENGAECKFTWDKSSGNFVPYVNPEKEYMDSFKNVSMPWEDNNEF